MKDHTHEILSGVHHLLSIATEHDLRRTANLANTSPHIRDALIALASERASTSQAADDTHGTKSSSKSSDKNQNDAQTHWKRTVPENDTSDLVGALSKSFENLTKSDIQHACQKIGLQLPMRPKETRDRIIRRVANLLVKLTDVEKQNVLSTLMIKVDSQTDGWVSVIRKKE